MLICTLWLDCRECRCFVGEAVTQHDMQIGIRPLAPPLLPLPPPPPPLFRDIKCGVEITKDIMESGVEREVTQPLFVRLRD